MTALGLLDEAGVTEGQTMLVVGATGGVGCFFTQLAAARGARVVATARADADAWIRDLGASETIDYTAEPVDGPVRDAHPEGVDVLLDTVSDPIAFAAHARLVRPGGVAVSIVSAADVDDLRAHGVRASNYLVSGKAGLLRELTARLGVGTLRVPVESEVPVEDAPGALARNREGGARGKTVIRP
jgi:NADPH:quinone reductase-like Zn-dependent oxidoreductase